MNYFELDTSTFHFNSYPVSKIVHFRPCQILWVECGRMGCRKTSYHGCIHWITFQKLEKISPKWLKPLWGWGPNAPQGSTGLTATTTAAAAAALFSRGNKLIGFSPQTRRREPASACPLAHPVTHCVRASSRTTAVIISSIPPLHVGYCECHIMAL